MAKHKVRVFVPAIDIAATDLKIEVRVGENKLGTVKISRGSIEWSDRNHSKGYHVRWEEFAELMKHSGTFK